MDIIISIGRGQPQYENYLGNMEWYRFQYELSDIVSPLYDITFTTVGTSTSPRWGQEESYSIGINTETGMGTANLIADLGYLADKYHQKAIAVTIGETMLVEP